MRYDNLVTVRWAYLQPNNNLNHAVFRTQKVLTGSKNNVVEDQHLSLYKAAAITINNCLTFCSCSSCKNYGLPLSFAGLLIVVTPRFCDSEVWRPAIPRMHWIPLKPTVYKEGIPQHTQHRIVTHSHLISLVPYSFSIDSDSILDYYFLFSKESVKIMAQEQNDDWFRVWLLLPIC